MDPNHPVSKEWARINHVPFLERIIDYARKYPWLPWLSGVVAIIYMIKLII